MKKIFYLLSLIGILNVTYSQDLSNLKQSALLTNNSISVTVGGNFIVTGTFRASINDRVDQFITRIYNSAYDKALRTVTNPNLIEQVNNKFKSYTIRGIKLKRADGEIITLDLLKFRLNGNFENNPYLKNDDVLIFPAADLSNNYFTISGAVNKPGKFYLVDGDRLSDAIEFGHGLNKAYENIKDVEISRLNYLGDSLSTIHTTINDNILLKRGDHVRIVAIEPQRKNINVYVLGEVYSPGNIPITKQNTTLTEVIKMAGGLKPNASLRRAKLVGGYTASSLIFNDQFGEKLNKSAFVNPMENFISSRMSNLTEQDTSYFILEDKLRLLSNASNIDFTQINDKNSKAANFIVKPGDVIFIPAKTNTVYVYGQIPKEGKITFVEGADYNYYIAKAGGMTEFADDDIKIIKSNTMEWKSATEDNVKIETGDLIWVPKNPHRSFSYYLKQSSLYFGIVGSVATIVLLVNQFNR